MSEYGADAGLHWTRTYLREYNALENEIYHLTNEIHRIGLVMQKHAAELGAEWTSDNAQYYQDAMAQKSQRVILCRSRLAQLNCVRSRATPHMGPRAL